MSQQIGMLGNGGQADEAEACFEGVVLFRAVSKKYIKEGLVDIASNDREKTEVPVVAAIGAPRLRKEMIQEWRGSKYATIVSNSAKIHNSAVIGDGTIVAQDVVITTNVEIGKHVIVNVAASIQHDSTVGDYATICPGVHIGGHATIGSGVFLGIGAIVANDVTVADGIVIGAGAVVPPHTLLDVENGVYIGAPARLVKKNKDWLYEI